jgi:hypothetical protein
VVYGFFELYSQRVRYGGDDTICWIPSKRKTFDVNPYYQVLSNNVRSKYLQKKENKVWRISSISPLMSLHKTKLLSHSLVALASPVDTLC